MRKNVFAIVLIIYSAPAIGFAQRLQIEALRPEFEFAGATPAFLTAAMFASIEFPLASDIALVGDIPFAFGELKDASVPTKDQSLGNIGFGVRFLRDNFSVEAAMRLPLAKNNFAAFAGTMADIDRQEAFIPKILPLYGMIRYHADQNRFTLVPYAGVSLNFKTKSGAEGIYELIYGLKNQDIELFMLYGLEGWWKPGRVHLGATYSGRLWISSGGSFSESLIHQLALRAKARFGNIAPGVLFRLPINNIKLDWAIGLNCEFFF